VGIELKASDSDALEVKVVAAADEAVGTVDYAAA
jgi:hypothetical protein